ncbi:sugar transferase, partial [Vibrio parahaemolyticus]|nr:sugar transferase [Vibrio parahaemolyticus]
MKNSRYDSNVCHAKRTFDVLVAMLILVVTAPLFPFIALAIKTTSKGPVIYRQLRVG